MGELDSSDGNGQEHDAASRVDSTGSVLCDASCEQQEILARK